METDNRLFDGAAILITGGTGSFGRWFVRCPGGGLLNGGRPVPQGFQYGSDTHRQWLTEDGLLGMTEEEDGPD